MRARLLVASAALVLALAGCSVAAPVGPSATPTVPAVTALVPRTVTPLAQAGAGTEAKRLADAIQGLISPSEIVYVDDHSQLTPATSTQDAFYGIIRLISIQPGDDPTVTAASMIASLEASGWSPTHSTDQNGLTLTSLVSTVGGQTWLVLLGGDATVENQSVVEMQLASPDLPK